jgi:hypothetical protein
MHCFISAASLKMKRTFVTPILESFKVRVSILWMFENAGAKLKETYVLDFKS